MKTVAEPRPAVGVADFSESLAKGVGFKFTNVAGDFVDFRLRGSSVAVPMKLGDLAIFDLPDGQAKYAAGAGRIKEEILLDKAPAANAVSFDLSSNNLSAVKGQDGGFKLVTPIGKVAFEVSAPVVWDREGRLGAAELVIEKGSASIHIDGAFLKEAAYPIIVDPTVVAADGAGSGLKSQRNAFFDGNRYWVVYSDGENLVAKSSTDSVNWTLSSGIIDSGPWGEDIATWYAGGSTVYVAYASDAANYGVKVKKGTINGADISWSNSAQAFTGSGYSDYYGFPSITQDANGRLWVAATHYDGSGDTRQVRAKRSTNSDDITAWPAAPTDISTTDTIWNLDQQAVALPNGDMYFIWLQGEQIKGRLYTASTATYGAIVDVAYPWWNDDPEFLPSAVVKDGVIYLAYSGDYYAPKYKTLSSPYTSWSSDEALANDSDAREVALTLDTSTGDIYAFYKTVFEKWNIESSGELRQVKLGEPDRLTVASDPANRPFAQVKAGSPGNYDDVTTAAADGEPDDVVNASGYLVDSTNDEIVISSENKFDLINFNMSTPANTGINPSAWYSAGDNWTQFPAGTFTDNTEGLTQWDNDMTFTPQTDWTKSSGGYYRVRIKAGAVPTVKPKGQSVKPYPLITRIAAPYSTPSDPFAVWQEGRASIKVNFASYRGAEKLGAEAAWPTHGHDLKTAAAGVNLVNGNLSFSIAAPTTPSRGIPTAPVLTYNSQSPDESGFGFGWVSNLTARLYVSHTDFGVIYQDGDGTRHLFDYDSWTDSYISPPELHMTLTESGGNYLLKTKDQITYTFDSTGKLTSIKDRNNNTSTYNYDSEGKLATVVSASDTTTTLGYDESVNRITSITDAAGRDMTLGYSSAGDLTTVADAMDNTATLSYDANHNLTGFTDARSSTTNFGYANDRVVSITDPAPLSYQTALSYGSTATVVDGPRTDVGDVTTYAISPDGLLTELTEPAPGGKTTYEYDADFNLTSATQPNTAQTSHTYDSDGNRLSETDPLTHTTYWSYNANNDVVNTTDALVHATAYSYDTAGNLTKKINADDTSETYSNNQYGQRTKMTNARGYDTDYTYTDLGLLDEERQGGGAVVTKHEYDLAGNETTTTDPLQHKTIQAYDDMGRGLTVKAPDGGKTFYEYDAVGNKVKESRLADLAIADMEADESWAGATTDTVHHQQGVQGRKKTSTNGAAASISKALALNLAGEDQTSGYIDEWVYVPNTADLDAAAAVQISLDSTSGSYTYTGARSALSNGWNLLHIAKSNFTASGSPTWANVTNVTNTIHSAAGRTATVTFDDLRLVANKRKVEVLSYDALNRLSNTSDAMGHSTAYAYDAAANQTSETNAAGTTSYIYDVLNRQIGVTDAKGKSTTKGYDIVGNLAWVRDANESTTTFAYDLAGRETMVTDPLGLSTRTEYDAAGNKLKVIDPEGVETTYTYDPLGRLEGVKDGLDNITSYEYDANGNQTEITPPALAGSTINAYDYLDRLSTSTDGADQTTGHYYDLAGRETTTTLPTGVVKTIDYDDAGRFVQANDGTTTITYAYDTQGNKIQQSKSAGLTEYFAYDDAGQLTKTVDSEGRIKSTLIDEDGRPTRMVDINGAIDFVYDPLGNLDNMKVEGETSTTFNYDNVGNRKSYNQANGIKTAYGFDDNSRLTSLETSKTSGQLFKYSYQYDSAGNITTETIAGVGSHTYGYDDNNQLTSWVSTSGVETSWVYDESGNRGTQTVEGGPTATYEYGDDNRLTSSIAGGVETTFDYDDNGNLISKVTGADTTSYTWNSDNQLTSISSASTSATFTYDAEGKRTSTTVHGTTTQFVYDGIKLIAEKDASDTITATYFYDDLGQLVSMKKNGQSYYFHLNHRGDVIKITDSSQTTVASYSYDPWGNILDSTGTFANSQPFRYASYYWDGDIGMYYLMARYYDSGVGRFVSKDGFPGFVDYPLTQNAYVYAVNRPGRNVDPSGEMWVAWGWTQLTRLSPGSIQWSAKTYATQVITGVLVVTTFFIWASRQRFWKVLDTGAKAKSNASSVTFSRKKTGLSAGKYWAYSVHQAWNNGDVGNSILVSWSGVVNL